MLKTQITGAKYLSPQTNQMTNLNIAVPADSKDTEFGTSDILLAKDVVAYLNALDSDISKELTAQTDKIDKINETVKQLVDHNLIKIVTELPTTDIDKNCVYLVPNKNGESNNVFIEYIYVEESNTFEEVGRIQAKVDLSDYYTKEETDNLILIAKNSAINMHNEDNTKSIKLDINDIEANEDYGSTVNVSLTDDGLGCIADINTVNGFTHKSNDGYYSNFCNSGLYLSNPTYVTNINPDLVTIFDNDANYGIEITANKTLTDEERDYEYSTVDLSLNDSDNSVRINANLGIILKGEGENNSNLDKYSLHIHDANHSSYIGSRSIEMYKDRKTIIRLTNLDNECSITLGPGYEPKFKISRPIDDTEGATITGVKSLTAFANPSATKVWATDGSTVDLTTKANASDVLLKKSTSGGYYIEENSNELGYGAFAANRMCTASGTSAYAEGDTTTALGNYSHAEGSNTTASGMRSHAEGFNTTASGSDSHAEGESTTASGNYSHAEGSNTTASGHYSHAEGAYNVKDIHAIHSVGIGTYNVSKNAEYIYIGTGAFGGIDASNPKHGYKYLIGVGGYDGINTDNTTYKSVQEVIADLTARIEQLETKVRALEAANTPA